MTILNSLATRFYSLGLAGKIYLFACGIFLLNYVCAGAFPDSKGAQESLMTLSALGFAIGFFAWFWPSVTAAWKNPIGKIFITILHLFVLLLATVFARFIVASSLELPPQDFDISVSFLSLVLYVPTWSIVISVVFGISAIIFEIIGLFHMAAKRSFGATAKFFSHMFGALAICFFFASIYDATIKNEKSLHPLVKWVAFFGDFQPAPKYPGVAEGERIRLHENGVISIAKIKDGKIQISVRKYEQ